jgi:SSS family solute:Na+ symporter
MNEMNSFPLGALDYCAIVGFFVVLSLIGYVAGRKERASSDDYFLAGRSLPWYVVGGSFIASNISTEHFIGMIGAAYVYGICVAISEWANVFTFSLLIWFFIPFLMASRVFTMPEFLEKRFNFGLRQFFAFVTMVSNIVAFLAAVLYGGGLALQSLFGWPLWFAIVSVGIASGVWAIYGGLSSVAWIEFFNIIVMVLGGASVTVLGLKMLAGDSGSILEGVRVMIEANKAQTGAWKEAVEASAQAIARTPTYDRLSIIQPATHTLWPWPSIGFVVFSVSIWYNVLNQFMIQRVLGAKNTYHARMGIVLAGFLKVILPFIIVLPGLILFAKRPEILRLPWNEVKPEADKGYTQMLQTLVPVGMRGLFLAALFGAIQSTVNSVLNSSATIITLDFYKRVFRPNAKESQLVRVGVWSSAIILAVAMVLAGFIGRLGGGLFEYVQSLYAFFAPPFAAIFLLGILFKRINAIGASSAVSIGFALGIMMKAYIQLEFPHPVWLEPFFNQAAINWLVCIVVCVVVSLSAPPPRPDQVTDQLTFNWAKLNIFEDLGEHWYSNVATWWLLFVVLILGLGILFSGLILK